MRERRSAAASARAPSVVTGALQALDAEGLRALIREIMPWLDESARVRLVNALVDRAVRSGSGWRPHGPSAAQVSSAEMFAEAAIRAGYADAAEVDHYLRHGSNAFLRKDYLAARAIFHALLLPVACGDVDLGQHEMLEEVLSVDVADCAARFVVSTYMTSAPPQRGQAVLTAMDDVRGVGHFGRPLREMERVSVEPLPGLEDFLPEWRTLAEARAANERQSEWETDADRWLREVVERTEGIDGLARLARGTKRTHDLRAWCDALAEEGDWEATLAACNEAAESVADTAGARGEFLDQAALAAQELGRRDLADLLERAGSQEAGGLGPRGLSEGGWPSASCTTRAPWPPRIRGPAARRNPRID